MITSLRRRVRAVGMLLVLALVAGPWPAALASAAGASAPAIAMPSTPDASPCPAHDPASARPDAVADPSPCPCCEDGGPCNAVQCVPAAASPALPVGAHVPVMAAAGADRAPDRFVPAPDPRAAQPLRPPIA